MKYTSALKGGCLLQEKKRGGGGEHSHIPPASLSAVRILIDFSSERCLDASFVALSASQRKHKIAARKEGKEKVQESMRRGANGKQEGKRCEDVGTVPPQETLTTHPQTTSRNFVL